MKKKRKEEDEEKEDEEEIRIKVKEEELLKIMKIKNDVFRFDLQNRIIMRRLTIRLII
jgi:hypothetical protein